MVGTHFLKDILLIFIELTTYTLNGRCMRQKDGVSMLTFCLVY
jgi:hypothetical protein